MVCAAVSGSDPEELLDLATAALIALPIKPSLAMIEVVRVGDGADTERCLIWIVLHKSMLILLVMSTLLCSSHTSHDESCGLGQNLVFLLFLLVLALHELRGQ